MTVRERLEQYIKEDKIYQDFIDSKVRIKDLTDFDLYCIQHCTDIGEILEENEKLKKQYCERTDCSGRLGTSKKVEALEKENQQLKERINKALNKIDNMFNKGDENSIIDDLLELDKILKGSDNDV